MARTWIAAALFFCVVAVFAEDGTMAQDYVPDSKTAMRIAEAVLDARYGEERVHEMLPLHVDGSSKDFWVVAGWGHAEPTSKGGGIAVWVNRKTGAVQILKSK